MPFKHDRYDVLDGMRGIAALSVAVFHFTQFQDLTFFYNSPLAVDFFFMLSGFVIAHSYGARLFTSMGVGEYFAKRVIRLYPLFALGALIGTSALMALAEAGKAVFPPQSLIACTSLHALFMPCFSSYGISGMGASTSAWGAIFPANPASWSLFFEMVAGLSFPLLCRLSTKALSVFVVASWTVFMASGLWLGTYEGHYSFFLDAGWGIGNFWVGFPRMYFGFGCGALLYRLRDVPFAQRMAALRPWMLYLALALAIAFPLSIKGTYHALAVTLLAPLVILAGAATRTQAGFSGKIAWWLGRLSYPLYCLHMPIGRWTFLLGEQFHLAPFLTAALALALSLAISWLAVALFDEPVRAWLSRRLKASVAAKAAHTASASLQNVLDQADEAEIPQHEEGTKQKKMPPPSRA